MINSLDYDVMFPDVVLDNLSVDAVCDLILSGAFRYVRVAASLLNIFYVSVVPEHFANQLMLSCNGERFTCTIAPLNKGAILYVAQSRNSQDVPF